jgi:hypothetical protein
MLLNVLEHQLSEQLSFKYASRYFPILQITASSPSPDDHPSQEHSWEISYLILSMLKNVSWYIRKTTDEGISGLSPPLASV